MPLSVLDIALVLVTAAASVGAGYWLRGWKWAAPDESIDLPKRQAKPRPAPAKTPSQPAESTEQRQAKEALAHLHDLAAKVAADVGAHSDRVQEINNELCDGDQTRGAVFAAMNGLIEANERMQQKLDSAEHRLQEQARQMESMEAQVLTDALTGIANRRAFDEFVKRQQSEFQRNARPVTVLMLDVDHFKSFNDTYGHAAGDEVLIGVARALEDSVRDVDMVARYGGEEFAIVFPGASALDAAPGAERAREVIERSVFQHEGIDLRVTASFGMAQLLGGEEIEGTIKRADEALYASKSAGRNQTHWHDGETCRKVIDALDDEAPPPEPVDETFRPENAECPEKSGEVCLDQETRLSGRAIFVEDVRRRVAEWKRVQNPLSLMVVGIDDLPSLSEQFGKTGRRVAIKAATQFLKATMREMDHVARLDEETFGLLLPGADLAAAESIAERLRKAIAQCKLPLGERQIQFTVSLGVAEATAGESSERLMARVETALRRAQEGAANRTSVHVDGAARLVDAAELAVS